MTLANTPTPQVLLLAVAEQATQAFEPLEGISEALAVSASAGEPRVPLQAIARHVDVALSQLQSEYARFAEHTVGNPEHDTDTLVRMDGAFSDCEQGLQDMVLGVANGNLAAVRDAASAVMAAGMLIAGEMSAHLKTLQKIGPTRLAVVNRALFHLQALKTESGETRFAGHALRHLLSIPARLGQDLDSREERCPFNATRPQAEAAAANLAALSAHGVQTLEGEWASLADGQRHDHLDALGQALEVAADGLTKALEGYVGAEATVGPTPDGTANLVLQAARTAWQHQATLDGLSSFVQDVQETLEPDSPLLDLLERMRCAALTSDTRDMEMAFAQLQALGSETPAPDPASRWGDDDDHAFDLIQEGSGWRQPAPDGRAGLPVHFQMVLDSVEGYLADPAGGADLAYHYLDRMTIKTAEARQQAAEPDETSVESAGAFLLGISFLEEAIEAMRLALQDRNRHALEAARTHMNQAAEILLALGSQAM